MWTGVLFGTIGALSRETWPTVWILIEVNLISFLPLIHSKWNCKKVRLLYFIMQGVGSLSILARGLMFDRRTLLMKWIIFGLLLKSALSPFHFWGVVIASRLTNLLNYLFLTWQKITPLFLIPVVATKFDLISILLINIMIGTICRIGSKALGLILFYSGLSHVSWVLSAPALSGYSYFLLYSIILAPIFLIKSPDLPYLIFNLAGLPPMSGFYLKLTVLHLVRYSLGIFLLLLSSALLYAYLRVFLVTIPKGMVSPLTLCTCRLGALY